MAALYGISYSKAALAFLRSKPPLKHRRQIVSRIKSLVDDPHPPGSKKLRGTGEDEEIYRIRSGNYRVLYEVRENPNEIVVLDIGHRKDIYRSL